MRTDDLIRRLQAVRGAIFDLDGTLLDSSWLWEAVDRRFFARRGLEMPPDYAAIIHAMELYPMAQYTIQRFSLPQEPQELITEWMSDAKRTYAEEVTLKPHARECLQLLQQADVRLGIATSCRREMFTPALKRNGVEALFSACITTTEIGVGKDSPAIYLRVAECLGVSPAHCMVLEDSPHGAETAKRAGFFTVGISDASLWDRSEEMRRVTDLYLSDFGELNRLLSQIQPSEKEL